MLSSSMAAAKRTRSNKGKGVDGDRAQQPIPHTVGDVGEGSSHQRKKKNRPVVNQSDSDLCINDAILHKEWGNLKARSKDSASSRSHSWGQREVGEYQCAYKVRLV
ncbi:hypothetical protein L1049_021042 [Liquidambar formosana]|uniref:Uncharacterized protein n=1 Tax=Liquidambar formosana TaxID=63359 RepID=A0AAP0S8Q7_LIQFO